MQTLYFAAGYYLLFFSPNLSRRRLDVDCMSEMCCTQLTENRRRKKSPYVHHGTTLSGYIFATMACIDNHKKLVKQQYLFHMSSQYGELRPTNGWDLLASLGNPSKFQLVSRLGFVTAPTSLNGGQQNFAGCLAVSWAGSGTLYTVNHQKTWQFISDYNFC